MGLGEVPRVCGGGWVKLGCVLGPHRMSLQVGVHVWAAVERV